jgi:hypothetical protein
VSVAHRTLHASAARLTTTAVLHAPIGAYLLWPRFSVPKYLCPKVKANAVFVSQTYVADVLQLDPQQSGHRQLSSG